LSDNNNDLGIAFVLPDTESFHKLEIHFGIAYISSVLKAHGFKRIRFFPLTSAGDYSRLTQEIADFAPAVVGFSSVETQFHNVINMSKLLNDRIKSVLVCGGTYPTIYPECLKYAPCLDGIFRGESELAFLELVKAIKDGRDYKKTSNFCYFDPVKQVIVKNELMPLETNLDKLGFADREIFDFQKIIASYGGIAPFMFNRGCPYNCAFCSNHAIASVYTKNSNTTRRRSVDSCIAEIKQVDSKYSFKAVHIWDDLFTSDRTWLYEFLDKYRKEINKPFMCTTRSNLCDDELFRRLKESGCYKVHMSLESGNEFIRNQVMKRNIPLDKVIISFILARKHKIRVNASSIIGLPFETEEMIKETIALLGKLKIEDVGVNVFYPYRGTRLRELCEQYSFIDASGNSGLRERKDSSLNLPHISKTKLRYYCDNFELLVRKNQGLASFLVFLCKNPLRKMLPSRIKRLLTGNRIAGVKREKD
jgi:anaerobic magnesium-protoporphyrin IX monomethyl ester cyclase